MSSLIVVAYDDHATAENVMVALGRLQGERLIELADAVVATRDDEGKIRLHQMQGRAVASGGFGGAMTGGLIGLLFFTPLLGMAIGGAAGALAGKMTDSGIDDHVIRTISEQLERGQSLLFLLVVDSVSDVMIPELRSFGGHIVQTSLRDDAERALRSALERHPATA